jgi:hypothetical protein
MGRVGPGLHGVQHAEGVHVLLEVACLAQEPPRSKVRRLTSATSLGDTELRNGLTCGGWRGKASVNALFTGPTNEGFTCRMGWMSCHNGHYTADSRTLVQYEQAVREWAEFSILPC